MRQEYVVTQCPRRDPEIVLGIGIALGIATADPIWPESGHNLAKTMPVRCVSTMCTDPVYRAYTPCKPTIHGPWRTAGTMRQVYDIMSSWSRSGPRSHPDDDPKSGCDRKCAKLFRSKSIFRPPPMRSPSSDGSKNGQKWPKNGSKTRFSGTFLQNGT